MLHLLQWQLQLHGRYFVAFKKYFQTNSCLSQGILFCFNFYLYKITLVNYFLFRFYLNGFIGGMWILVEKPNRRLDIGMYSLRLSIETLWKLLVKKGKVRNIRYMFNFCVTIRYDDRLIITR